MTTHAPPFDGFRSRTFARTRATPPRPIDPSFRGIRIAAPPRVAAWHGAPVGLPLPSSAMLPLAGLACASGGAVPEHEILEALVLVAVALGGPARLGRLEPVAQPVRDPVPRSRHAGAGM